MSKTLMKPDEMQILKCVSMKLDDEAMLIATQQYHTEKDPETGKNDRTKSRYRWLARVCKIEDVKKSVQEMLSDAHRLEAWKWPNDPSWNGKMYTKDSTKYYGAKWLNLRLSKMVDWETGQKWMAGHVRGTDEVNLNSKYETEGYLAEDGSVVSLTDKNALLNHIGQNLLLSQQLKTVPYPETSAK